MLIFLIISCMFVVAGVIVLATTDRVYLAIGLLCMAMVVVGLYITVHHSHITEAILTVDTLFILVVLSAILSTASFIVSKTTVSASLSAISLLFSLLYFVVRNNYINF